MSPEGYYLDSFDIAAVRRHVLDPLGPEGSCQYVTAVFDHLTDRPVAAATRTAPPDSVLLFDGIFLFRPELDDAWDFRIFVEVSLETSLRWGIARDGVEVEERYRGRYLPAQGRYVASLDPAGRADLRIVNDDPSAPLMYAANSSR